MKTQIQNKVIEVLRNLRNDKNLSQACVARHLGISPGQLGNIESCRRSHKYTLKQIYSLCQLLEVPAEYPFAKVLGNVESRDGLIQAIIQYQDDDKEKNSFR